MIAAHAPRETWYQFNTATASMGSAPGTTIEPHFTIPPYGESGLVANGFALTLSFPASGAVTTSGSLFDVTLYRLLSTGAKWAQWEPITGMSPDNDYISWDAGGGASFFVRITNITVDGNLLLAVTPLV